MSTKIRWGILATGNIAATFTEDLLTLPDAEVVAVGSRSKESARAFADRYGIPRAHGSWADLAADPDVDIVYVATPHHAHREATALCLEAGKPVLCEKAFTLDAADARYLVDLARDRGLFLMEAMWMRCNPAILKMAELIADGAIGPVRTVQADFGLAGPFPAEHRLRNPALGGGALLDLGVYPVSFAQLVLGRPDSIAAHALLTPEGVDENTGMLFGYDSGANATLTCSIGSDTAARAFVAGPAGRIELPPVFFRPDHFTLCREGAAPEEFRIGYAGHGMTHEAAEAMRCLREGLTESPLVPWQATLDVMDTLDEVRRQTGVRYPGEAA
ncbi:Gfo/Idh/MocA family oxidoreductase [Longispora sp. K20-0274]|uniref:Gfo/Idh/MocA family protein n=1 Tax=Longispora sp. K20-0274 TaxID=3088255 RepID=UPI00399A1F77